MNLIKFNNTMKVLEEQTRETERSQAVHMIYRHARNRLRKVMSQDQASKLAAAIALDVRDAMGK